MPEFFLVGKRLFLGKPKAFVLALPIDQKLDQICQRLPKNRIELRDETTVRTSARNAARI